MQIQDDGQDLPDDEAGTRQQAKGRRLRSRRDGGLIEANAQSESPKVNVEDRSDSEAIEHNTRRGRKG
jgi:hypothetical protein